MLLCCVCRWFGSLWWGELCGVYVGGGGLFVVVIVGVMGRGLLCVVGGGGGVGLVLRCVGGFFIFFLFVGVCWRDYGVCLFFWCFFGLCCGFVVLLYLCVFLCGFFFVFFLLVVYSVLCFCGFVCCVGGLVCCFVVVPVWWVGVCLGVLGS